jgi:hypothetical protein
VVVVLRVEQPPPPKQEKWKKKSEESNLPYALMHGPFCASLLLVGWIAF